MQKGVTLKMYFVTFFVLTGFVSICSSTPRNNVVQSFQSSGIVPNVIATSPRKKVTVKFLASQTEVNLGNELKPSQVQSTPFIEYPVGRNKNFYTLLFIDPDAPTRDNPSEKNFVHWLVGNIPQTNVDCGTTLAAFLGSAPPPDSGEHRYTFLVYKQPRKIEFNETGAFTTFDSRKSFSIEAFTEKYNYGDPYAGNFYVAFHEN